MKTYNVSPYFDDYSEDNNFYQVMFKPGLAVQARELTQLQTILRGQIEKFGNHIFQHGSIVIPGNSTANLAVPYVKLENTYAGFPIDITRIENKILVGVDSGVEARVQNVIKMTDTDPLTLYVGYISGGKTSGVPNGEHVFRPGEELYVKNDINVKVITKSLNATGIGSIAYVAQGVYYVNGTFVSVDSSSVIIDKYGSTPSCHVLLKINEEIVNFREDDTLLDNSQGSNNYAAPGADRLKIYLTLETLPLNSVISNDYVEIMRFNVGILEEHSRFPKYNELEKSLAQRTYEESGDYIAKGLKTSVREHLKIGRNLGAYENGDTNKYLLNVSAGKAYNQGFGVETLVGKSLPIDKARTSDHVFQDKVSLKAEIGQYILISTPRGKLDVSGQEQIELWNISEISGGTLIGTAYAYAMDYHDGAGSIEPVYKLYLRDINLISGGYGYEDIGGIRLTSGLFSARVCNEYFMPITSGTVTNGAVISYNAGTREAKNAFYNQTTGIMYAHKHTVTDSPLAGDTITTGSITVQIFSKTVLFSAGQSGSIIELPNFATKALKTQSLAYDMSYTAMVKLTMSVGTSTVSISNGVFVPPEIGTFIALSSSTEESASGFTLSAPTQISRTGGNTSVELTIYCQAQISSAAPRTKSVTSNTETGVTASATITLAKADVFGIKSIRNSSVELKNQFVLDPNSTDFEYRLSKLKLKDGYSVPSGPLTIEYDYFLHSNGDFFTVDSYPSLTNEEIPSFISPSSGREYKLRDCIDFRKTVGQSSNSVINGTFVTTSVQRYLPRYDLVCLTKNADITVITGIPSETNPKVPVAPAGLMPLSSIYIPAYGYNITDVKVRNIAVDTYTMKRISQIETRISNLEEYSTLTAAEAGVLNTPFIDAATGLDRYKTGYFVESMVQPDLNSSSASLGFKLSMDSRYGIYAYSDQTPMKTVAYTTDLTSIKSTGGVVTLNYTEVPLAKVAIASKTNNLNPFEIISWEGVLTLFPPEDNWVDTVFLPEINVTNNVTNFIDGGVILVSPPDVPATPPPETHFPVVPVPVPTPPPPAPVIIPPAPVPAPVVQPQTPQHDFGLGSADGAGSNAGTGGSGGDGGGGGGGGKIICTALWELGEMEDNIYLLDQKFGKIKFEQSPEVMIGYHMWANTIIPHMNPSTMFGRAVIHMTKTVATPWAEHMTHVMSPDVYPENFVGKYLMEIGESFSVKYSNRTKLNVWDKTKIYSTAIWTYLNIIL